MSISYRLVQLYGTGGQFKQVRKCCLGTKAIYLTLTVELSSAGKKIDF